MKRWTGVITAGCTHDGLLSLSDMLATFAALVDRELPEWAGEDSVNQLPVLLGESDASLRETLITQSYTGVLSVRDERWKLILDTKGSGGDAQATPDFEPLISPGPWQFDDPLTGQLYDLENDPYETTDLFEDQPEQVNRLINILNEAVNSGRSR